MALMTASALRDAIPELTGTAEDTKLDTLIARADGACARFLGIPPASATGTPTMESTSYTFYLTGNGGRELWLPLRTFTAITSIYDDPNRDYTDSTYLVSSADYALRWDPQRGQHVYLLSTATHGAWSDTDRAIRVVGTAGYSSGAAPGHILEAVRIGLRNWWEERKRAGKLSTSGQASVSYMEGEDRWFLCPEVKAILGPERLPAAMVGGGWA